MIGIFAATFAIVAISSFFLTGMIRTYALSRAMIDLPGPRSSHRLPTPRGGGATIALHGLIAPVLLLALGRIELRLAIALFIGGFAVSMVGWLDDHRSVRARYRLAVHIASSVLVVASVGGVSDLSIGTFGLHLGWIGSVLCILGVTWLINLYNFMDGIDGLAAAQAMIGAAFLAMLLFRRDPALAWLAIVICAAVTGFLPWNWAPARIFMGDVASGYLGFVFGSLVLFGEKVAGVPAIVSMLPFLVFVLDATVTLLRRLFRGEAIYMAHRTHVYQRLVQSGWSHRGVSLGVGILAIVLGIGALAGQQLPVAVIPILLGSITMVTVAAVTALRRITAGHGGNLMRGAR